MYRQLSESTRTTHRSTIYIRTDEVLAAVCQAVHNYRFDEFATQSRIPCYIQNAIQSDTIINSTFNYIWTWQKIHPLNLSYVHADIISRLFSWSGMLDARTDISIVRALWLLIQQDLRTKACNLFVVDLSRGKRFCSQLKQNHADQLSSWAISWPAWIYFKHKWKTADKNTNSKVVRTIWDTSCIFFVGVRVVRLVFMLILPSGDHARRWCHV